LVFTSKQPHRQLQHGHRRRGAFCQYRRRKYGNWRRSVFEQNYRREQHGQWSVRALDNTTGGSNTATGLAALGDNTTGSFNTAGGANAPLSNTTGGNTADSGVTAGTNVICIGSDGANVNNSCFIGNIHGVTTEINDAIPVVIDSAGQLTPRIRRRIGDPVADADFLWSRSPLSRVDDIRVPVLVAHGANDPRVPLSEAEQLVAALRHKGISHEFLCFPDEGHGFVKPVNQLRFYAVAEQFLARHLGGRHELSAF